jgi:hypothetical protein
MKTSIAGVYAGWLPFASNKISLAMLLRAAMNRAIVSRRSQHNIDLNNDGLASD